MPSSDLHYLTIADAWPLLRDRKLSPVELTRAFLDRTERLDDTLQAYITVLEDGAMAEARSAESAIVRGDYVGPLHGIPIALKDLYDTAGVPTTAGSRVMAGQVPTEDATARLKSAGAVLLGKLAMSDFAMGGPDPTTGFPIPRNPWNLEHSAGGLGRETSRREFPSPAKTRSAIRASPSTRWATAWRRPSASDAA